MSTNRRQLRKNFGNLSNQNKNKPLTVEKLKLNSEVDIIRPVRSRQTSTSQKPSLDKLVNDLNERKDKRKSKPIKNYSSLKNKVPVEELKINKDTTYKNEKDSSEKILSPTNKKRCFNARTTEDHDKHVENVSSSNDSPVLFTITSTYTINENSDDSTIQQNINLNEPKTDVILKSEANKRNHSAIEDEECSEADKTKLNESAETPVKRKRGRAKGYKRTVSDIVNKESIDNGLVKKRGRPRGKHAPKNSLFTQLLDTVAQQLNDSIPKDNVNKSESSVDSSLLNTTNGSISNEESSTSSDTVVCAVCQLQMGKTAWTHHKYRFHNNLAWRTGDEPLDLNDKALVIRILTDLYKRKKPLYCEKCNAVKKSPIGYLSHKSVCLRPTEEIEAARVSCTYCNRSLLPVSLAIHLKICKILNPESEIQTKLTPTDAQENDAPINSKRKAATKANDFLKNLYDDVANENNQRKRRKWHINYDFQTSPKGKKFIQEEINNKGTASCSYSECTFQSEDLDKMISHMSDCSFKSLQSYTCMSCFVSYNTEDGIVEHSKKYHDTGKDEDFDCEDEDQPQEDINVLDFLEQPKMVVLNKNMKKYMLNGINFLIKHRYFPTSAPLFYPPAAQWTYKFCINNFCSNDLFPRWRMKFDDIRKLENQKLTKYLPQHKYSVYTATVTSKTYTNLLKLEYAWKRYKLFESEVEHDDTASIFCGGAITATAWLPTPYDEENAIQILAVSTNSNFNKGYPIHQLCEEPGLIQFWNCGSLKNSDTAIEKPTLQFCLAHDYGPIWCLEWCPSGCYDKNFLKDLPHRLGLLAVGSANSYIYIYSICLPDSKSGKLIRLKPVLRLKLNSMVELAVNGIEAQVTKLSWTTAKEHHYLAAGYSNGMIAIFNLNSTASLLIVGSNNDDIKTMLPYQVLSGHFHSITALHLYHLNDGRRWLMSASSDRSIKYWDLENPSVPISSFTKFIVKDGVWLNNWISTAHTYEDCCGGGLTQTTIQQLRNYECVGTSILHSNSCVSTISGSDWTNSFIQGNAAGEITGLFPHQLFYLLENDKTFRIKRGVLGYARVIEKEASVENRLKSEKLKYTPVKQASINKSNSNDSCEDTKPVKRQEPTTYEEADDIYGLVFCDMIIDSFKELPDNANNYYKSNSDKFYPATPHIYPLQSINQIVINPNCNSYCYYATGYQAGFVRISNIKSLNKNSVPRSLKT